RAETVQGRDLLLFHIQKWTSNGQRRQVEELPSGFIDHRAQELPEGHAAHGVGEVVEQPAAGEGEREKGAGKLASGVDGLQITLQAGDGQLFGDAVTDVISWPAEEDRLRVSASIETILHGL